MNKKTLAQHLDFANHHQDATPAQIKEVCQKVKKFGFHTAFVNSCYVSLAKKLIKDKVYPEPGRRVGTVVSFPLGQDETDIKVLSAIQAVRLGADELDVCMNLGWFKAKKYDQVLAEMEMIVAAAKNIRVKTLVKFIIETGLLTASEIKKASELVLKSGADFVKTCSGYGPRGASLKDIELIKSVVGNKIKIKAAGGIRNYDQAVEFINAGVHRIGTSKAVEIVEGAK